MHPEDGDRMGEYHDNMVTMLEPTVPRSSVSISRRR